MRAFDGVRVLELGQVYLGPYCGLLFAQMGAEVIKVEPPGGEPLRFRAHDPIESHEFVMLNSNKRSVMLDLKSEAGHQALLDLVGTADVLIENFAPGVMERLQLGPARLLEHNPRLVVASGKGYGTTGPYAHMSAMDITVQAMSGAAAATGQPDGPPTKAGAAFVDFSGGVHLFAAITAALFQRERTGRGQIVEVSMHDTVYPMLASSLGGLHNNPDRELPERTGNRHTGMAVAPYNIYDTSDGWLAIICMSERHWRGLATAMGRPELIDDPRFRTAKDRVANIDAVDGGVLPHHGPDSNTCPVPSAYLVQFSYCSRALLAALAARASIRVPVRAPLYEAPRAARRHTDGVGRMRVRRPLRGRCRALGAGLRCVPRVGGVHRAGRRAYDAAPCHPRRADSRASLHARRMVEGVRGAPAGLWLLPSRAVAHACRRRHRRRDVRITDRDRGRRSRHRQCRQ